MIALFRFFWELLSFVFSGIAVLAVIFITFAIVRTRWMTRTRVASVAPTAEHAPDIFDPAVTEGAAVSTASAESVEPEPNARVEAPRPTMAAEQTWAGVLAYARNETRSNGKKTYEDFCVALDCAGAILQLWGADLKRAIKDSNANVGDRVRVNFMGYGNVPIKKRDKATGEEKTKMVKKKLYTIAVLT